MPDKEEKLYTFKELQTRLKTSERSLRRWISEGQIDVLYIGRQIRVEEKEVKRFVESKRRERIKRETQ